MMTIKSFRTATLPQLIFGVGHIKQVAKIARQHGTLALLVTGRRSFVAAHSLLEALDYEGVKYKQVTIEGEPSPSQIDAIVAQHPHMEVVIGLGGGAVIDAGKAISAMLPIQQPIKQFLEGVGDQKPPGLKVPYIACPTTAGTGAEVTKNAVITEVGPNGFKKSLRHDHYIPNVVVIDPALACSCPPDVTASCGMDALTQLLEAFVSTASNPFTDAFARSGLKAVARSLSRAVTHPNDLEARSDMAWAAYASGVSLAHAGLGIVHGLASPIGGYYPIPHGVVCGTLLPAATQENIRWLLEHDPDGEALAKHIEVASLFGHHTLDKIDTSYALADTFQKFKEAFAIADLSHWSVGVETRILDKTGLKNNPAQLNREEITHLLIQAGVCHA